MARIRRNQHYSFEEKKLVLEEYLLSAKYKDMNLSDFSKVCNINYSTFREWGKKIEWDATRIDELKRTRKKTTTLDRQSKLSEVVQDKIVEIAEAHRTWGPLKIKQYLWRHEQILVPQTSIYYFMKERGLVKERKKSIEKEKHNRSFEYPSPLSAVQMDLMHVTLTSRVAIHLVTLLDDYSRFILNSRFVVNNTMDEVIDVVKETVRSYGVFDHLLTDCGTEFVSWQKFTRFEELMVDLGVEYIASGPDKKENQGKLERWHQTVRQELRDRGPLDYSSEAQLWIRDLCWKYNYERPHQAIGGLVPADRFFGMREEIEAELERCYKERQTGRQIYFICRVGDKKLVVSGQNRDNVSVCLDAIPVQDSKETD